MQVTLANPIEVNLSEDSPATLAAITIAGLVDNSSAKILDFAHGLLHGLARVEVCEALYKSATPALPVEWLVELDKRLAAGDTSLDTQWLESLFEYTTTGVPSKVDLFDALHAAFGQAKHVFEEDCYDAFKTFKAGHDPRSHWEQDFARRTVIVHSAFSVKEVEHFMRSELPEGINVRAIQDLNLVGDDPAWALDFEGSIGLAGFHASSWSTPRWAFAPRGGKSFDFFILDDLVSYSEQSIAPAQTPDPQPKAPTPTLRWEIPTSLL